MSRASGSKQASKGESNLNCTGVPSKDIFVMGVASGLAHGSVQLRLDFIVEPASTQASTNGHNEERCIQPHCGFGRVLQMVQVPPVFSLGAVNLGPAFLLDLGQ